MDDSSQLEQLLTEGYQIVGPIKSIADLLHTSISNFLAVFDITDGRKILLDPRNRSKSLIMLRNLSTQQRVEIITSDEQTINRALAQQSYQDEPIGLSIHAQCSALGGRSIDQKHFNLDQLIPSLNGLLNWQFKLSKTAGTFEAIKQLDTTNRADAVEELDKLEHLFDSLAYIYQVGFFIQHYNISYITRLGLTVFFGSEERMLQAITKKEFQGIEALLTSPEAIVAAKGLNQSYIENLMASRLSMLWSAAEDVFSSIPEHLLTKDEITDLLMAADKIVSLNKDTQRLNMLKESLHNPDRLPLKSRNLRMAEAIAPLMNINTEVAYSEVRKASKMRGKSVHGLSNNDIPKMKESEAFLQKALISYIAIIMASEKK